MQLPADPIFCPRRRTPFRPDKHCDLLLYTCRPKPYTYEYPIPPSKNLLRNLLPPFAFLHNDTCVRRGREGITPALHASKWMQTTTHRRGECTLENQNKPPLSSLSPFIRSLCETVQAGKGALHQRHSLIRCTQELSTKVEGPQRTLSNRQLEKRNTKVRKKWRRPSFLKACEPLLGGDPSRNGHSPFFLFSYHYRLSLPGTKAAAPYCHAAHLRTPPVAAPRPLPAPPSSSAITTAVAVRAPPGPVVTPALTTTVLIAVIIAPPASALNGQHVPKELRQNDVLFYTTWVNRQTYPNESCPLSGQQFSTSGTKTNY